MRSLLMLIVLFAALTLVIPVAAAAVRTAAEEESVPAAAQTQQTQNISEPPQKSAGTSPVKEAASLRESYSVLDRSTGEIAVLPRRDLIRGMLASEMPFSYEPEALRAQAVAAHTWAEYQALHPDPALGGADFSADPSKCEGYLTEEKFFELHGSNAKEAWQRICDAADYAETRLLLYEGEPALCAYHAMSAGRTEDAGNVWQTSVPYLVPVDSEGDLEQEDCLVRTKFGTAQMRTLLTLAFPTAVLGEDPAGWIEVLERSESGYVTQVRVGGAEMHGQKLRTALSLRSTAFDFTYEGGIFSFETKGYGHGVGLSQVGANRLAQEGATAEEILLYYYPGTLLAEAK